MSDIRTASWLTTLVVAFLVFLSIPDARANDKSLVILTVAGFIEGDSIPEAVRRECDLETYIPRFVHRYASKAYPRNRVADAGNKGKDQVLKISIVKVHAPPGGKYSGAKWVQVKGELSDENGKLIGSFTGQRTTGGFKLGKTPGKTCKFLQRVGRALGKDIGIWLRNPSIDSYIGEMAGRNANSGQERQAIEKGADSSI